MCAQAGIIQVFSTTETPQLNGEAERLMRTLVEAARTLAMGAMCQPICARPKFNFGERVTCYVDKKRRQTKAAKQVDPLGKMQLPS